MHWRIFKALRTYFTIIRVIVCTIIHFHSINACYHSCDRPSTISTQIHIVLRGTRHLSFSLPLSRISNLSLKWQGFPEEFRLLALWTSRPPHAHNITKIFRTTDATSPDTVFRIDMIPRSQSSRSLIHFFTTHIIVLIVNCLQNCLRHCHSHNCKCHNATFHIGRK